MKLPFKMITETKSEDYRYKSFWDKEKETVEWIESFDEYNVFFDVGANVGVYSLYAAYLYPKSRIYAFEPVYTNYMRLLENINLNLFDNIIAMPFALSNQTGVSMMFINDSEAGKSGSQIENPINDRGEIFQPIDKYPISTFRIDDFKFFNAFEPNHIKIDVDGNEVLIVSGMIETLKKPCLKSVLIEINTHRERIIEMFIKAGFTMDNRFNQIKNHSRVRRQREGIQAENVVFCRK